MLHNLQRWLIGAQASTTTAAAGSSRRTSDEAASAVDSEVLLFLVDVLLYKSVLRAHIE
jgi:hypothetical protein